MDIPAFTMKVVQSEEDLFYYALRNGHGEPILPRWSKPFQARAQDIHHEAYVTTSRTLDSETVSDSQTVAESGAIGICRSDLFVYIIFWCIVEDDTRSSIHCQELHGNKSPGLRRRVSINASD